MNLTTYLSQATHYLQNKQILWGKTGDTVDIHDILISRSLVQCKSKGFFVC